MGAPHGQTGPQAELPDAGRRDDRGAGRIGGGQPDRIGEGGHDEQPQQTEDERESWATTAVEQARQHRAPDDGRDDEQERPDDVVLLLDRQRPVVLDRRGDRVGREVVHGTASEGPVDEVDRRGHDVRAELDEALARHDEPPDDRGDDQDEVRGRQQPPGPPGEERRPRDRARLPQLAHEQARDQEAREDKEDVDAEEAAGQGQTGVIDEDEEDGERTQALEVGAEAARGLRPGHAAWPRARRGPRRAPARARHRRSGRPP